MIVNAINISRIYFLQIKLWFAWFFLYTLLFPIGLVFFIRATGGAVDTVRLISGATLLSISTIAINSTGYWVMTDRFQHRLEIIRTLPFSLTNYYMGIMIVSLSQALLNVHLLIIIFRLLSYPVKYTPLLIIVVSLATAGMSILGIIIGRTVKDTSHGSLMMNLLSTGAVLICPVFYSDTILPAGIAWAAALMPHTVLFKLFYSLYSGSLS